MGLVLDRFLDKLVNVFGVNKALEEVQKNLGDIEVKLNESIKFSEDLTEKITIYEDFYQEYVKRKSILDTLEVLSPDMLWAKDTSGRYIYANYAIKSRLLQCANPLGLTDIEIAEGRTRRNTDEHSSAGEVCFGSDLEVLEHRKTMGFLERFVINGKEVILHVVKTPMYDGVGKVIGTVGTGRDITNGYNELRKLKEAIELEGCSKDAIQQLNKFMEIYNEC